eukprot:Skav210517  [mRNA]  locus=scaffold3045:92697:93230:+ [translate_table: standard]
MNHNESDRFGSIWLVADCTQNRLEDCKAQSDSSDFVGSSILCDYPRLAAQERTKRTTLCHHFEELGTTASLAAPRSFSQRKHFDSAASGDEQRLAREEALEDERHNETKPWRPRHCDWLQNRNVMQRVSTVAWKQMEVCGLRFFKEIQARRSDFASAIPLQNSCRCEVWKVMSHESS